MFMVTSYLDILPLAQLPRPYCLLLSPRLLPTEDVKLSLRPPCLQVVSTLFTFHSVFL